MLDWTVFQAFCTLQENVICYMLLYSLVSGKNIVDFVSLFLYAYLWGKKEDDTQSEFLCSVKCSLVSNRKQVSWDSAIVSSAK